MNSLYTPWHKSAGLSLVELMVALAISLFMLAALVQIMAGSTQTFRTNDGLSRIQEGGRYAIEIIGRQIRSAGYHSHNVSLGLGIDLDDWPLNGAPAGSLAIEGADGADGAPDSLTIRYFVASDCAASNCVPAPVTLNDASVTPDTWIAVTLSVDANRSLIADVRDQSNNQIHQPANANGLPLVDGVSDMQLTYGINQDGKLRYATATTIAAEGSWQDVISVRVNLVMDSVEVVSGSDPSLADSNGLLQRPYSATFTVRNRVQGA
ncbi:MAG: PilW family protein [Nevskiales bacterium]